MIKKAKKRQIQPKQQKTRAKYKCPTELDSLIIATNLVPIEIPLPSLTLEIEDKIRMLREETSDENAQVSNFEVLTACMKDLPKDFHEYLKNLAIVDAFPLGDEFNGTEPQYKRALTSRYIEYFHMRNSVLALVQRLETERQAMRDAEASRNLKKGSLSFQIFHLLNWETFPLSITTVVKRTDDGKLHNTGLANLIGKFDDSRLRRCEICNKIFWAKREDSKTCSPKCLNVLNVRVSRSLTPEEKAERKAKRIANAKQKKQVKELRKKKNESL